MRSAAAKAMWNFFNFVSPEGAVKSNKCLQVMSLESAPFGSEEYVKNKIK